MTRARCLRCSWRRCHCSRHAAAQGRRARQGRARRSSFHACIPPRTRCRHRARPLREKRRPRADQRFAAERQPEFGLPGRGPERNRLLQLAALLHARARSVLPRLSPAGRGIRAGRRGARSRSGGDRTGRSRTPRRAGPASRSAGRRASSPRGKRAAPARTGRARTDDPGGPAAHSRRRAATPTSTRCSARWRKQAAPRTTAEGATTLPAVRGASAISTARPRSTLSNRLTPRSCMVTP